MPDGNEARLQRLEDHTAVQNLIVRYGPLADSGDAVGVAALWTEDGVYVVGGYGEAVGRAAIADLIRSPTHRELMQAGCAHVMSAPTIEIGGDTAIAVNYSMVMRHHGDAFEAWRVSANRWALVRTDSGWLVSQRDNHPCDGSAAARALLQPGV